MDDFWTNDDDEPDWFQKADDNDDDENNNDDGGGEYDGAGENAATAASSSSSGTHHTLLLIDCDAVMFTPTTTTVSKKEGEPETLSSSSSSSSYMNDCMNAIQAVVRNKIRTVTIYKAGKRDGIGIVLYNTKYRIPISNSSNGSSSNKAKITSDDTNEKKDSNTDAVQDNDEDNDDDDDDDEEDEDLLYMRHHHNHHNKPQPSTNVHEYLPLEPPGVSTIEQIKRCCMLPSSSLHTSSSSPSSSVLFLDLEKEYSNSYNNDINDNKSNYDDDDFILPSQKRQQQSQPPPPLLLALRKALAMYNSAVCVKKTRTTSVGKFEEPDIKHIWIITPYDDPCRSSSSSRQQQQLKTSGNNDEQTKEYDRLLRECITDIKENDIQIHVWPIIIPDSKQCNKFDTTIFYDNITTSIFRTTSSDNNILYNMMSCEEWIQQFNAVYKKIRPAYRVPFLLPNWKERYRTMIESTITTGSSDNKQQQPTPALFLDFYSVQQVQKEPSVVYIHQSTGKPLGKVRQLLSMEDGGGHVLAEQRSFDKTGSSSTKPPIQSASSSGTIRRKLGTFFEFGNEHVPFSLRDKVIVKKQCNSNPHFASLILLGFKPANTIPFYHTIEKSYFAYPSESSPTSNNGGTNGASCSTSVDTIAHLHASMIRKNVIGIGELLTRTTATSRLVVIRPISEVLRRIPSNTNNGENDDIDDDDDADEVYMLERPPGLLISAIPFEDEMRIPSTMSQNIPVVPEDIIQATMQLIETQTFSEDVTIGVDFANAAMNRFWNYIERIAYNEDSVIQQQHDGVNDVQYDTEIDSEKVLEQYGDQINALRVLLPESVQLDKVTSSNSRGAGQKRKAPVSQHPTDDSGIDWFTLAQNGTISKCTVPDLKSKLRSLGEPVNGNKAALVERLEKYFAAVEPPIQIKQEDVVAIKQEDSYL